MTFLTDHSPWLILLCVLAGMVFSGFLYFKNHRDGLPRRLRLLLAGLRFLAVFLISLLFLDILVKHSIRQTEEPLLILVQDNSSSVVLNDSVDFARTYNQEVNNFVKQASDDFDVRQFVFGEDLRQNDQLDFTDQYTDMSSALRDIEALYNSRNIGAVIFASDGIYNRGLNPAYPVQKLSFPVYTVALGDTMVYRDVLVNDINHNRITFLGNKFPVEIVVEAKRAQGLVSRLSIEKDGQRVFSRNISFSGPHYLETILIELDAEEPGMQQYTVSVSPVEAEPNTANNSQQFFIEVIDSRQKILLLADSPHPDIGALKQSLEDNQHFEVEVALLSGFSGYPESYNLVVFHQLPSVKHPSGEIDRIFGPLDIPQLFIVGRKTSLTELNKIQNAVEITSRAGGEVTEALPETDQTFSVFSLSPAIQSGIEAVPPLYVPFAEYEVSADASILFHQKISDVITDFPLFVFNESGGRKTGLITGEGIWRWKLHIYSESGSHQAFDDLFSSMIQYLSLIEDKGRFRIKGPELVYENDPVIFEAEFYNPSYELVNDPEVQISLTGEDGTDYSFFMSRTLNGYRLDAGSFPSGRYTWESVVSHAGESFSAEGVFLVSELNIEALQTVADHNVLFQLASSTGGEMFFPGQLDQLLDSLNKSADIQSVVYLTNDFDELVNLKAIFFLLLLLLSAEWFIRKRSGSY